MYSSMMGIGVALLDTLGFIIVSAVLFFPVVWMLAYFVIEAYFWKTRPTERYYLEELKPVSQTLPLVVESGLPASKDQTPSEPKIAA